MRKHVILLGALLVLANVAQAGPLYGVASYAPFTAQGLYQVDPQTGLATLIGSTGLEEINDIAWHPQLGQMLAHTTDGGLYSLDLATGGATFLADVAGIFPEGDLAVRADGLVFATDGDVLGTLATDSGGFSPIGALGALADDLSGLAFDASGVLYGYAKNGSAADSLISINAASATASLVGMLGISTSGAVGGLDFAPDTGILYLSDGASLYTVDTSSGLGAYIGAHGKSGMSGLAFIPEPASMALLALGLLTIMRRR